MLWLSNFPTLATVVSLKVGTNGASMTAENPVQASCVSDIAGELATNLRDTLCKRTPRFPIS
ncbi:hypothetical protein BFJ70_g6937 [Fusarium oxysporum]|nr:hypothetical protein BFJ70_g6937 [Fusarium oxysporum]